MGTTVTMRVTNKVDDAMKFIRVTSDLIVYQDLLKTVHQAEYQKYQQWCDEYYKTAERFDDIYEEYDEYMKKLEEWKHEHVRPIDPQNGVTDEEQKQIDKLIDESSYTRIAEISSESIEIDKPQWLIEYVRHINNLNAVGVSGMTLLSYADVKTIVNKLSKCKDAESAKKEFPVASYYHDSEEDYWKWKLDEGLTVMNKLLNNMNKNDFVVYMET